ncbi:Swi5 [Teratosphaeria destructans]|uniref:Swi5 n=1 Tax=Teratosphaeria destructans TaxID=418781 RepID=A0A9W7STX2_9PEZI|nr:Swi5 [Teratosphaeria destructans]
MSSPDQATTQQAPQSHASSAPPPSSPAATPVSTNGQTTESPAKPTSPPNPRLAAIEAKRIRLEATLADLQAQRSALVADAKLPSGLGMPADWSEEQRTKQALATANGVIKEHISLLHKYNEIKDIGQGLMGLIADKRGVRIADVMEDFGVSEKD